ncbi:unnamed protein product [Periconia digitata]|uniref:FAD/NAD(P)-binding domain-containing protein n=1 Tax=Periconia digitata TaxID=1303443 RepID=A0A9W4UGH0_9PLEO|nr:unnamed protein product [Periconia digitata]
MTLSIVKSPAVLIFTIGVCLLSYTFRFWTPNLHRPTLTDKSELDADVLVIGGGPAGLSGALTLVRHQHDMIIFDNGRPRNQWDTPLHVLPTWEHRSPSQLREASRRELQATGLVRFVDEKVVQVEKIHDSLFSATSSSGAVWSGKKVMLATGVDFIYPDIPGYTENFPERILHCLFTRGFEFKGSASAGIIAADLASSPPHAIILGEDAGKFAENVTVYTNGDAKLAGEISELLTQKGENNISVDDRQIKGITRELQTSNVKLSFERGPDRIESFLVHQSATRVSREIVVQLGLETNARGDIVTSMPFYQTNVTGVFAAGDSASPFKMIPNAIFQGSNAGAGVARDLPRRITKNRVNRLYRHRIHGWLTDWW